MKTKITIKSFFGFPVKNLKIKIIETTKLFDEKKEVVREKKFEENENTEFNFKLDEGEYILRVTAGKVLIERKIKAGQEAGIKLPLLYNWFSEEAELSQEILSEIAERNRWDKGKCYKCKKEYTLGGGRYRCKYCDKFFCSEHRLPEHHDCQGNPTTPKEMRRIFQSWRFREK